MNQVQPSIDVVNPKLRPMACEQRKLCQPDGSGSFQQGRTAIMAAVYGPVEVRLAREIADRATLEVIYKPKVGMPSSTARAVEKLIRGTVDGVLISALHPRTSFTIIVQELQDSGSMLACCVNAVCAALLDSCAPLTAIFGAVCCSIDPDGRLTIDPDERCENAAAATATFVFESKTENVLAVTSSGVITDAQFQTCLAACRDACRQVFAVLRETCNKRSQTI